MERNMDTYQGQCIYCGAIQPILAMDQVDADQKISEQCSCGGAMLDKKKKALLENLDNTIGEGAVVQGFKRVTPEQEELITKMAMAVLYGKLERASCQINGTTISITMISDKCKVKRTDKRAMSLEA